MVYSVVYHNFPLIQLQKDRGLPVYSVVYHNSPINNTNPPGYFKKEFA